MKKLIILVSCLTLNGCMWNMLGGGGGRSSDEDDNKKSDFSKSVNFQLVQSYSTNGTVAPEYQWANIINITNDKELSYSREVGGDECGCNRQLTDDELDELISKVHDADLKNFVKPDSEECQYAAGGSVESVGIRDLEGEKVGVGLKCATDEIKELNNYIKSLDCPFSSDCDLE